MTEQAFSLPDFTPPSEMAESGQSGVAAFGWRAGEGPQRDKPAVDASHMALTRGLWERGDC